MDKVNGSMLLYLQQLLLARFLNAFSTKMKNRYFEYSHRRVVMTHATIANLPKRIQILKTLTGFSVPARQKNRQKMLYPLRYTKHF